MEDNREVRVRNRQRACTKCRNQRAVERRRANPVSLLQHRWYNSATKLWPAADPSLWSMETVRGVYNRWGGCSVISEEADVDKLCVSYFHHKTATPPALDELVLLTTKEAQSVARMKHREACFPAGIRISLGGE